MKISDILFEGAKIDPTGWGETPYGHEIDYYGLQVQMKPSTFLKLALPLDPTEINPKVVKHMEAGGKIAPAMLYIEFPEQWNSGDYSQSAKVVGHEGRSRMMVWLNMYGGKPVQVNIKPRSKTREWKRKTITDEIIAALSSGVISERGSYVRGPLFDISTVH